MNKNNPTVLCYQRRFGIFFFIILSVLLSMMLISFHPVNAQEESLDEFVKFMKNKRIEITDKERELKREDERLKVVRKAVDKRIKENNEILDKINRLLKSYKAILKNIKDIKSKRMQTIIKAYESMPPENAAVRLSQISDERITVKVLLGMKSRKSGAIMALIEEKKAAKLTEMMSRIEKILPSK